ncbi:MAG: signal peptidase I [Opitutus sp.]|nr:signal peptidase I [Opitutus sp.]
MFGLFESQEKKMRENAANWLEVADKVYHFRRDVLTAAQVGELQSQIAGLQSLLKARAEAEKLKLAIESLEDVLRRTGGAIYPKSALVENVEFFLVAAIVILGIRTYFVQPFKIPTNSMWPTYNGMTPEVFAKPADEPAAVTEAVRMVAFGAWPHRLDAPASGEILIPVGMAEGPGTVHYRLVAGRSWLVIPTQLREYTLLVDEQPVKVRVPLDFDFDWVVSTAFFPSGSMHSSQGFLATVESRIESGQFETRIIGGQRLRCLRTGRHVRAGERVLGFDEMTGDQLFVDRFSYNFVRPTVGSGFVFRTGNIPDIARSYGDQYYIKRLVGGPGDTLQIKEPVLWRNGQPVTGAEAFDKNGRRVDRYRGYFNGSRSNGAQFLLNPEEKLTVPPRAYFAMGDNSGNSADGRYWGFVPGKDVIGRPVFVYFPFTRHWGPAR